MVNDPSKGVLPTPSGEPAGQSFIPLPAPSTIGTVSVEKAIAGRRSVREFYGPFPGIADIAQMLWAMQGVTGESGYRAVPSAGALYPLEISVACRDLPGLSAGVYHYLPGSHALERIVSGDVRENLHSRALRQDALRNAPVVFIIAADYNRTTQKYGSRGIRYVDMEAGHAAQNLYLQAYALGYGTVAIGAFDDDGVRS
ncbi:MAG: nitroreductase, partial [Methanoregula sp.]